MQAEQPVIADAEAIVVRQLAARRFRFSRGLGIATVVAGLVGITGGAGYEMLANQAAAGTDGVEIAPLLVLPPSALAGRLERDGAALSLTGLGLLATSAAAQYAWMKEDDRRYRRLQAGGLTEPPA